MRRAFAGNGTPTKPLRQINFEDAKEVEGKDEHNRAHEKYEIGIGELRRPDWLAARRFNDHQHQRQAEKPDENSGDKGEATAKNAGAALPRLLNKTEDLQ